jgi:hypothetical protein
MNSYNLPTVEQISAYHAGIMPLKERRFLEARMKKNPFINEVVLMAPQTDLDAVKRISGKVSNATHHDYFWGRGLWTKAGTWIGLSAIVLLLSVGAYFYKDMFALLHQQENQAAEIGEQAKSRHTEPSLSSAVTVDIDATPSGKNKVILVAENEEKKDVLLEKGEEDEISMDDMESPVENERDSQKIEEEKLSHKHSVDDQKRDGLTMTVLAAKSLVVINKTNPDDTSKSDESKYPSYVGGDQALKEYLKQSMQAIQVPDAHSYDQKATVTFTISNKGKLMSKQVTGNIHPTHLGVLLDALDNFPKFNSGKTKVMYTIEIKF